MNERWWEDLDRPYLVGATLVQRRWTRPVGDVSYDHDHCAFCFAKFSDTEPDALREGFTTADEALWMCGECVAIAGLRERFQLLGVS